MKWKTDEPKIGDTKTKTRMAWLPTKLSDGYTVWLETYKVHLRYETRSVATKGGWLPRTGWFETYTTSLWVIYD